MFAFMPTVMTSTLIVSTVFPPTQKIWRRNNWWN